MTHRYDTAADMARETITILTTMAAHPYNASKKAAMEAAAAHLETFADRITATPAVVGGEDAVDGHAIMALMDAFDEMKAVQGGAIIARIRKALDAS